MPSWIQRASLLLLFFLSFDTSSLVFGAPQQPPTRLARQLKPLGAETNAKRFARGLGPLPPVRRGSATDTARRSTSSDTEVVTKMIKVSSADGQNTIGFLTLTSNKDRYIVGSANSADQFQATLFKSGGTSQANFFDTDAPGTTPNLAGLISPGTELISSNSNAAILGGASPPTSPGSTPQGSGTASLVGTEYETAIWNYTPSPPTLTPSWVNHDGSTPSVSIVWDPVGQTVYLTANPSAVILNHPGAQIVTLSFI